VTHPPVIGSFTPSAGFPATPVIIRGDHFNGTTSVNFDGRSSAVVIVLDDHTISALVPVGAHSGKISVTTPEGTAVSSASFTVLGL